jgi:hypothetical protein
MLPAGKRLSPPEILPISVSVDARASGNSRRRDPSRYRRRSRRKSRRTLPASGRFARLRYSCWILPTGYVMVSRTQDTRTWCARRFVDFVEELGELGAGPTPATKKPVNSKSWRAFSFGDYVLIAFPVPEVEPKRHVVFRDVDVDTFWILSTPLARHTAALALCVLSAPVYSI